MNTSQNDGTIPEDGQPQFFAEKYVLKHDVLKDLRARFRAVFKMAPIERERPVSVGEASAILYACEVAFGGLPHTQEFSRIERLKDVRSLLADHALPYETMYVFHLVDMDLSTVPSQVFEAYRAMCLVGETQALPFDPHDEQRLGMSIIRRECER